MGCAAFGVGGNPVPPQLARGEDADEAKKIIQVGAHDPGMLARPFVLPPGQTLRKAFADTLADPEFLRDVSLIGSPAEVLGRVKAYAKAGVSHFETKFIYPSVERVLEMMRLFGAEVIEPMQD